MVERSFNVMRLWCLNNFECQRLPMENIIKKTSHFDIKKILLPEENYFIISLLKSMFCNVNILIKFLYTFLDTDLKIISVGNFCWCYHQKIQ